MKGASWLSAGNGLLIPLTMVQGILTARLLGVSRYGMLALGLTVVSVVGGLLSFRMQDFVVKWVTQLTREPTQAATAFRVGALAEIGASLAALAVVEATAKWTATTFARDAAMVNTLRLLGLMLIIQCGRESMLGMMSVKRSFKQQAIVQVTAQVVALAGVTATYVTKSGLMGVVVALLAAEVVRTSLIWILGARAAAAVLGPRWITRPWTHVGGLGRQMARFAMFTNLGASLGTVSKQGDLLVIGLLLNPAGAGYYRLAQSMTQLVLFPVVPMATAAYPEISLTVADERWADLRRHIRQGTKLAAAWLVPLAIALSLVASPMIRVFYGPDFTPAAPVLAILLAGLVVDGVLYWNRGLMLALGCPGYLARLNMVVIVLKFGLAFAFVPLAGYLPMAAAASVASIFGNAVVTRRAMRIVRTRETTQ